MPDQDQIMPVIGSNPHFGTQAKAYAEAGFRRDLLTIIPPGAAIIAGSKSRDSLIAGRGKVPGTKVGNAWAGFGAWQKNVTTPEMIRRWETWNCGLGLLSHNTPGLDIDIDVEEVADAIELLALEVLGSAPARFGRGARRLLSYRGQHRKRRLVFNLPGTDAPQAVELLGDGQQYVVEGIHPKTGRPYTWRDGVSPANLGASGLTTITAVRLDEFYDRAELLLGTKFGATIMTRAAQGRPRSDRTVHGGLAAPSTAALSAVISAIPNDRADVDYDTWIKIGMAIKAASEGSEEGYIIWEEWSLQDPENTVEMVEYKWKTFDTDKIGWTWLTHQARPFGFRAAPWEFDALPEPTEAEMDADERAKALAATDMFARCVWVEKIQCVVDLHTLTPLNREQFNWRFANIGHPADSKGCAWSVFGAALDRRRTVKSLTYRPGGPLFVYEEAENGLCLNIWRGPTGPIPETATAEDAKPWLDHLTYLFGDGEERDALIHWLAWVVQNPALKPNWGVLIGSPWQGNGKSILLEPVRYALGGHNVRELGADDLSSGYSDWMIETKLFVVEEMHSFERKATMNKLKNYLATPPWELRVNPKYGRQFSVPNVLAGVFFTNHGDALALEKADRRFFVLWTEVPPRDRAYYLALTTWFKASGSAVVARYLLSLDVANFDALGIAPGTSAKEDMRKHGRSRLDEWIEEGMQEGQEFGTGPFGPRLIALDDLRKAIPQEVFGKNERPSSARFRAALIKAGAHDLDARVGLGPAPQKCLIEPNCDLRQARLYSLRDHQVFEVADRADLPDMFWAERIRAQDDDEPVRTVRKFGVIG